MTLEEVTWMKNWTYRVCSLWTESPSWKLQYQMWEKMEKDIIEGNPILSKEAVETLIKSYSNEVQTKG